MSLDGACILVVDDHDDLAENLMEILEAAGARTQRASSAEEVRTMETAQCDVALVDIRLPDATGLSLLPHLRATGDGLTEVLLITGSASLDDAMEAVRGGAFDYIVKPFDPANLLATVGRAFERVQLRQESARLAAELERSEARLRTLVSAVQAHLLVLDKHGAVVQANSAVEAATGLTEAELVSQSWFGVHTAESDRDSARDHFEAVLRGDPSGTSVERTLPRQGGEPLARWISWQSTKVVLDDGTVRVYRSGLDVTETRELERRARVAERLAAVGTMSAGLAHEIRNPLNAANLQLQLLERRVRKRGGDDEVEGPTSLVRQEISRLSRLVDDFLAFARPTDLTAHSLDLCDVARRAVDLTRPDADARGISLDVRVPDVPMPVQGDAEKLHQVVLNLIRNAVEALENRGKIEVAVERDHQGVHLLVHDDGPGISEADLSRIYEPFFSTKPMGTGLGLAICHKVIAQHGGELRTRVNGGTTMDIVLPVP